MNHSFGTFRHIAEQLAFDYAACHALSETDVCMDDLIESFLELAQAQLETA